MVDLTLESNLRRDSMISNIVDASGNICKNWEANSNGTVLGTFKCPLPFEPSNFKYCCGKADLEHCCEFKNRYVKVKYCHCVLLSLP